MILKTKNVFALIATAAIMFSYSCSSDDSDDPQEEETSDGTLFRANLSINSSTIEEGESAVITLALDQVNNTGSSLVFDFTFGGTADPLSDLLSLASTELTIPNGETETTLEVTSIDDDIAEETETFTLDIGSGIPDGATAGTTTSITLNISDND